MKTPLLFVGWDGADWRYISSMLLSCKLPNLSRLIEAGTHGSVRALLPYSTSATWCNIVTGRDAAQHGIVTDVEPDGRGDVQPPPSTSRLCPALWNYATQHRLECGVVGFPATAPAEPINGVMVSDRFCEQSTRAGRIWSADDATVSPSSRFGEFLDLVVRPDEITAAEVAAIVGHALSATDADPIIRAMVAELLAQTSTVHNITTHLIEHSSCSIWAVRYRLVLSICRAFIGIESRPLKLEEANAWKDHCVGVAYELLDMMLGRLLELVGADSHVVLVSNHGFDPNPKVIAHVPWDHDIERWSHLPEEQRKGKRPHEPERHYTPYGIFVAAGPRVAQGRTEEAATHLDVLPTLLALADINQPSGLMGRPKGLKATFIDDSESSGDVGSVDDGSWPIGYAPSPWFVQECMDSIAEVGAWNQSQNETSVAIEQTILRRYLHLGLAHFEAGRFENAWNAYRQLSGRDTSFYVHVHLAECLLALRRLAEADLAISRMEASAPNNTAVLALRSHFYTLQGQFSKATDQLRQAEQERPGFPQLLLQLGCSLLEEKQFEEASSTFQQVLRIDEQRPLAHLGLVVCCEAMGDVRLARHHRQRARELGTTGDLRPAGFLEGLV